MAGYAPSFLGSTDRSVSGFSMDQSVRNCLQEVEDDNVQEDEIEGPPLSPHQGETTPLRDQLSLPPIRRPLRPPGPESLSSRSQEGILALMHDPFGAILNHRKHKAHSEVFSTFTGRPRGNDPNHFILKDAGLAMAKRVLHLPEEEPKRRQGLNQKPRRPPTTTRTRSSILLRGRTKMNLVNLFLIILHRVIPPFLSCASLEPVWTLLLPPSLGILISQSAFLYS